VRKTQIKHRKYRCKTGKDCTTLRYSITASDKIIQKIIDKIIEIESWFPKEEKIIKCRAISKDDSIV